MKSGYLPETVRNVLQLLADNKVLSKTKPNRMHYTIEGDVMNIIYSAGKYDCLFIQLRPTKSLTPIPVDSYTTQFGMFHTLYTPFLYPILNPLVDDTINVADFLPEYSYGAELIILEEVFTRGKYILKKANLSENLLPQFLALAASRVAKRKDDSSGLWRLDIEGEVKFTTVQIVKYLQQTSDVEEIISMWELGVLPEQYQSYKNDYADAPEEWVKAVFEANIKAHWEPKK